MVTGILSRGDELKLKSDHLYPLEMSLSGGIPSARILKVKAGTLVVVAEDCGSHEYDIPFHFIEESLKKQGRGQPFFAHRYFLEAEQFA